MRTFDQILDKLDLFAASLNSFNYKGRDKIGSLSGVITSIFIVICMIAFILYRVKMVIFRDPESNFVIIKDQLSDYDAFAILGEIAGLY